METTLPFALENLKPEVIIFGGLTLGLLALIWVFYKFLTNHSRHTDQVIERNTNAWVENTKSNQKLVDVIERWHEKK